MGAWLMQKWICAVCTCASLVLPLAGPVSAAAVLFVGPAIAGDPREQRVDLYDRQSNRQGYVVIGPHGRIDVYDRLSNRTGTGRIAPDGKTIELFDLRGNRTGTGHLAR